jgi:DNA-binding NtrC family response regulator
LSPSSTAPARILVVDDDPLIRRQLEDLFASHAYSVASAANCDEALGNLRDGEFSLAVVDLRMPDRDGITLTTEIRECWPETDVIMITGHGSIKDAVDAMSRGACDFITKPFEPAELIKATQKALERRRLLRDNENLRDDNAYLRRELSDRHSFANMVTCTPAMSEVFSTLEMLSTNDVTVIITGESGTGKELAARAVHFQGKRRDGRFVAINCAAVPEPLLESELFGYERGAFTGAVQDRVGKIELANGGTLFLDEVESIPLAMQAKLLRVLEERAIERLGSNRRISVDMRVVAATNQDLAQAVADGQMREDFYYRINVVPVRLPPLRQRLGDLAVLAEDYFAKSPIAREKGIERLSHVALAKMASYSWPGNIRELRNVLERALLTAAGEEIEDVDLPGGDAKAVKGGSGFDFRLSLREFLKAAEKEYLVRMLSEYRGSIAPAARHAVIDQATLHRKIRLHGLRPNEYRRNGRGDGGEMNRQ